MNRNPIRVTMWLADIDLNDVEWFSPEPTMAEKTPQPATGTRQLRRMADNPRTRRAFTHSATARKRTVSQ